MQTSSLRALKLWAYVLAVQTTNVRVQASRPSSRQSVYHLLRHVRHRQKRPLSETYQTLQELGEKIDLVCATLEEDYLHFQEDKIKKSEAEMDYVNLTIKE